MKRLVMAIGSFTILMIAMTIMVNCYIVVSYKRVDETYKEAVTSKEELINYYDVDTKAEELLAIIEERLLMVYESGSYDKEHIQKALGIIGNIALYEKEGESLHIEYNLPITEEEVLHVILKLSIEENEIKELYKIQKWAMEKKEVTQGVTS